MAVCVTVGTIGGGAAGVCPWQVHGGHAEARGQRSSAVVAVVGKGHLKGIEENWESQHIDVSNPFFFVPSFFFLDFAGVCECPLSLRFLGWASRLSRMLEVLFFVSRCGTECVVLLRLLC